MFNRDNQEYVEVGTRPDEEGMKAQSRKIDDAIHKITAWRIAPILLVSYIAAHLDRINIGFAKQQMTSDLGFSDTAYGLGAGLFFIAYAVFGVPSSLMLNRFGPRRWISSIMVVWGILSAATFMVSTPAQFYVLRLLLGVAEAGFFPGILVYINRWFPADRRAQITALFALAVPAAGMIGGPVSGTIIENLHDVGGLRGWQWMFLLEGLPVVMVGLWFYMALPDRVHDAPWLTQAQKDHLVAKLAAETRSEANTSLAQCVRDPKVWLLVGIYCAVMLAVNTISFWMPALIHGAGVASDSKVGFLSAVPYLLGCVFMIAVGYSSDRLKERRWHLSVPLLMSAAGLIIVGLQPSSLFLVMVGLVIAGMGASTALPSFWQLPPAFMAPATLAAGIAFVSSLGSIASFFAPYFIGWMRDTTQSASLALYLLSAFVAAGALLVLRLPASIVNPR